MIPLSFITLIILFLLFINPIYPSSSTNHSQNTTTMVASFSNKKLRRLPHVFGKVLELPFKSDADVHVEERSDCLKFYATSNSAVIGGGIELVELHPGIVKVVVRRRGSRSRASIDELELDVWRFRLPMSACPELATVVYERGQLVVTVPKKIGQRGGDCRLGFSGSMGNLLTVQ